MHSLSKISFLKTTMSASFVSSVLHRVTSGNKRDAMPLLDISLDEPMSDPNPAEIPTIRIEQPSTATANGNCTHDPATHLRAKLRYFFMSPCWKWHLKRQFPWKAWFQFVKIIIVTAQVSQYENAVELIGMYFV